MNCSTREATSIVSSSPPTPAGPSNDSKGRLCSLQIGRSTLSGPYGGRSVATDKQLESTVGVVEQWLLQATLVQSIRLQQLPDQFVGTEPRGINVLLAILG